MALQLAAMLEHLDGREAGFRLGLQRDPLGTLGATSDVAVRLVPDTDVGDGCSVAGAYIADNTPPLLAVAASVSSGRQAFTALHEYGHHLQQTEFDLIERSTEQADDGLLLEEAASDGFAAALLLPDKLVSQHVGDRGPTASSVVSLWRASVASRAAACVRAAQALKTPGHIVLLDLEGRVAFASSRDLPPLRRTGDQSGSRIVKDSLGSSRHFAQGETNFAYRDGIRGQELYAQTADMDGFVVVVAVTESAPWLSFSIPKPDVGPVGKWCICEHSGCAHEFQNFDRPCGTCGFPTCPECGRCACGGRVRERICTSCYTMKPAHLFDPGVESCRDCR